MKKAFTFAILSLFVAGMALMASAQTEFKRIPKRYINLGYVFQNMDFTALPGDDFDVSIYGGKSKMGYSAEFGTTYFLNKVPLAGIMRIGIDFSYLDLQYAQFEHQDPEEGTIGDHFGELGIQVGPSLTISPVDKLNIKAQVRYAPTMSAYISEDWENVLGGYAGYITGGASVSYSAFTLGFELRGAISPKLSSIKTDGDEITETGTVFGEKRTIKAPATRLYLGFRF